MGCENVASGVGSARDEATSIGGEPEPMVEIGGIGTSESTTQFVAG
jgi:hypothetical protein